MRLSVQESNLVSIYHSGSLSATAEQIREALPYMNGEDSYAAQSVLIKLNSMTDSTFAALNLDPQEVVLC